MKDPAFLYYDGDAARDVSHMNRLERGCYFDLIQAQRKFGRLTKDIIRKILGKDFDTCWESVKICLTYDNDMYFIEWLENSTIKRKEYSESRRKNRLADKQQDTKIISESYDKHMENENENNNIYTYSEFYDSEIEKSKGKRYESNYLKLVQYLYGMDGGHKFQSVLKLRDQLLYDEFEKLMDAPKPPDGSIKKTLEAMENYKPLLKHSNTIYKTVLSYWNMDFKRLKK